MRDGKNSGRELREVWTLLAQRIGELWRSRGDGGGRENPNPAITAPKKKRPYVSRETSKRG